MDYDFTSGYMNVAVGYGQQTWSGSYTTNGVNEFIPYTKPNQNYNYSPWHILAGPTEGINSQEITKEVEWLIASNKRRNESLKEEKEQKGEYYIMKRLVQLVVVDPDKRVEDNQSLVYMGPTLLTSIGDEDLILETDLREALAKHNDRRGAIEDEDRSDKRNKSVYLKPRKLSELEIRVVVLETF